MGGNSEERECHLAAQLAEGVGARQGDVEYVIQIIVPGGKDNPEGLSKMQEAEALMASMWGVEVVKLDCREVKGNLTDRVTSRRWRAGRSWRRSESKLRQKFRRTLRSPRSTRTAMAQLARGGEAHAGYVALTIEVHEPFDQLDADQDGKVTRRSFARLFVGSTPGIVVVIQPEKGSE